MTQREREDDRLEQLARAAGRGDSDAFRELAERIRPRVFRWALARTGHPDDAEDVAQRVLVALHRHLAGFEGRARFTTWLYRVTANAASAFVRSRTRRRRLDEERVRRSLEERVDSARPVEHLETRRLAALVLAFCRELPERQRDVFDLADLQGYPLVEIAAMLDVEPVTVRTHLHRARRTIRERILSMDPDLRIDRT